MGDDYATVFLNSAFYVGNPLAPLTLFFLFLARFAPIIALSPFLGARVMPHPVKVVFALTMYIIFLPQLLYMTKTPLTFNVMSVLLILKEVFVGFCLGFIVSLPFTIVQSAGIMIDHQRGGASLMVNDPTVQNQSSPLGTLFNYVLIYVFYLMDGPFLFIDSIAQSYEMIPPDQFINPQFFERDAPFWKLLLSLLNQVMKIAVQLATPALIAILMTDTFLGIANRLAPQVQITFLGMPLKSLLGLLVIFLGWKLFVGQMVIESHHWLNTIKEVLLMFQSPQSVPIPAT